MGRARDPVVDRMKESSLGEINRLQCVSLGVWVHLLQFELVIFRCRSLQILLLNIGIRYCRNVDLQGT